MSADPAIVDAFAAADLFAGLPRGDIERIAATAKRVHHPAGKQLTSQGESGVGFHLILEGTATVSTGPGSAHKMSKGAYFGEISLIDGKPRSADVTAETDLETASMTSWNFRPLLDEVPGLAKTLLFVMCERLRRAEHQG
ncbi:MAG TPA: cyclic nucleotide-binding domain-containing protein [Mycobacteriales bacterium]|nr:cyclic nucleotide-binding domain-containing protein [Mycobacteriales bacterium]